MNEKPDSIWKRKLFPRASARAWGFIRWLFSWRMIKRYLFCAACLATLIAIFYAEENWRGKRAWTQYRREAEARGVRFGREAFIPPLVPDEQNFAMTPMFARLYDFEPGTQKHRDTNAVQRVHDFFSKIGQKALDLPESPPSNSWVLTGEGIRAQYTNFLQHSPLTSNSVLSLDLATLSTEELATRTLACLSIADSGLDEMRAAVRRPSSRFNIKYDNDDPASILLPHLSMLGQFDRLLRLRASAALSAGRTNDAFNDVDLMFRLIETVHGEPVLISQLVRFAQFQLVLQPILSGLASRKWSDAQLQAFQQHLEALDFCKDTASAMDAERAFFAGGIFEYYRSLSSKQRLRAFEELMSYSMSGKGNSRWPYIYAKVIPTGWYYFEQINYDRALTEHRLPAIDVEKRRVFPGVSEKSRVEIDARKKTIPLAVCFRKEVFCIMFLQALPSITQKTGNAQASVDLAKVACALERYRLARGGHPQSLDALTPEFIKTVPHDVITGAPLKYRVNQDGSFLLYSVGWNEKDDGGTVAMTSQPPHQVDPLQGDWVWPQYPAK